MSSSAKFPKHYWVNALVLLVTIPSRPVAAAQESSGAPVTPVTEVAPTEEASRPLDPLAPRRPEPEKSTPSAPRGSTFAETVVPSETEAAIILQEDAQDIEHVAEIDTREGFRIPGSYIHVAPGILSVVTTDGACMYAWGISGGSIFARHKNRVVMLENPPMSVRSSKASIRLNYRDDAVVADIEMARKNAEDLLPWLERREEFVEFLVGLENAEMQPVELARIRRDVAMARRIIRVNKRALAELNRLPRLPPKIVSSSRTQEMPHVIGSSDPEGLTEIEAYTDVRAIRDPDAQFYKEIVRYLDFMRLEELIRETDTELVAARSLADHPPENYVPMTIDAVLRGWPLPIADEGKAAWVDAWVERHQPLIWAKMHEVLRTMGADSTGDWSSMGVFHSSDVIFKVTHDRKLIYVTPYFMIPSSFFIVAEPSRRLVRYETATADQNLDFSYFEMEDAS